MRVSCCADCWRRAPSPFPNGPQQLIWVPKERACVQVARSSPGSSKDPVFGSSYASEPANSGNSSQIGSNLHKDQGGSAASSAPQQGEPVPAQASLESTSPTASSSGSSRGGGGSAGEGGPEGPEDPPPSLGVRAALSLLAFYRNALSPLMPANCRFLPSCSLYSIDSYKKFGVARGTVLTAWRLMRCNPWGGRGYDPPAWPPVGLGWLYQYPATPEVSVVLMVWLAYWLVTSTWDSLAL